MKKVMLMVSFLMITIVASAQGWYSGGEIGIWRDKGAESTNFSLVPDFGYNFSDKWSVGAKIGFYHESEPNLSALTIDAYVRYTYYRNGMVALYADGGAGFGTIDVDGYQVGISPGIALKLDDHFSILASFGYFGYRDKYHGENGFGIHAKSSDLKFGFYYSF